MVEAVIVDVDDTLCLTEAACFELENTALARMGHRPMPRSTHIATWGRPLFEAILDRSPGVDVEAFKAAYHPVIEEFISDGRLDSIPAENYDALDRLIVLGKTIMLLTSRTHTEIKHMLEPDHSLATRVKAFYYRDTMQFHKPDPRAFDALLYDHDLQPGQCVYIGDSPSDAQAANGAGLRFIASLESGIREPEDFKDLRVDAFINRFSDIVEAIGTIEQASY
ncbi:MAG TPA: HAD-IA family hydrolase [Candidatus Saccharimonadales bacterium]|nr:HAD-IA family hydrolase [Candidatus Saccharimonadales bacterium]